MCRGRGRWLGPAARHGEKNGDEISQHKTLHLPLILYHTFRVKWNVKVITRTKIDNRGTEDRNSLDQELLYL